MTGTIRRYFEERGFGFIRPDQGGKDIFVHIRALTQGNTLHEGDHVEFEMGRDERLNKDRAENVRVIDEPEPAQI
jgi:CspA family cold shock protein